MFPKKYPSKKKSEKVSAINNRSFKCNDEEPLKCNNEQNSTRSSTSSSKFNFKRRSESTSDDTEIGFVTIEKSMLTSASLNSLLHNPKKKKKKEEKNSIQEESKGEGYNPFKHGKKLKFDVDYTKVNISDDIFDTQTVEEKSNSCEERKMELMRECSKKWSSSHPLQMLGYSVLQLPELIKLPKVEEVMMNGKLVNVFNNEKSCKGRLSVLDDMKRYSLELEVNTENKVKTCLEEVSEYLPQIVEGMWSLSVYRTSVLCMEEGCSRQVCHRDGKTGFLMICPLTDNYEICVVPRSHIRDNPLYYTESGVEELHADQYEWESIKLKRGKVFLARRKLVHWEGVSRKEKVMEGSNITDVSLQSFMVYPDVVNNADWTSDDMKATFVRFKELHDYPHAQV